jgi:hypothetical protein
VDRQAKKQTGGQACSQADRQAGGQAGRNLNEKHFLKFKLQSTIPSYDSFPFSDTCYRELEDCRLFTKKQSGSCPFPNGRNLTNGSARLCLIVIGYCDTVTFPFIEFQ